MVVVKLLDQNFNAYLFSNPENKVFKSEKATRQICLLLSTRITTFSPSLENNDTLKCYSKKILTTLTNVV